MAEVLKYLVGAYKPLVEADFSRHKNVDWMEGLLIAHHSKVLEQVSVYIVLGQLFICLVPNNYLIGTKLHKK